MDFDRPEGWPAGLARQWVVSYNRFIFSVIALREVARQGWPAGCLQDIVTDAAVVVVEAADQLRAMGYGPHLRFAGEEGALWGQTVKYVCALPWRTPPGDATFADVMEDAVRVRAAWERFTLFVWGLSDDCFARIPALGPGAFRPDGVSGLFGKCANEPGPAQAGGQPAGEGPDEPTFLLDNT